MVSKNDRLHRDLRLGDVARLFAGASTSRSENPDGIHFPVVGVRHIDDGLVTPMSELDIMSFPSDARALPFQLQEGDVLVTGRGTVLKFGIVGAETAGAIASGNIIVVRPTPPVRGEVLFAILSSEGFRPKIEVLQRGATTLLSLSPRDLAKLEISLPTIEEQNLISEFVRADLATYSAAIHAATARRALARGVLNARLFGTKKKD
ncbi:restriction endonuclease subunit S [Sinorhizobium meliloti]|uniref:restriction endonuclease subunit S n=1 Tax=Rhizobium meliloti TaxID=382 RepID=UPI000FD7880A|nr:restriction endonuclease subunit S [Sinorhizobium meliloti]RVH97635.1 restriction endonuclease subunit S [Sinorhizobium meliloti]RVK82286.1 restriction endonuclease subunit S [Sinorhizobium meliloti]RVL18207.1 restriction endonuclease subunit S [Sinorhizobium meliloti]RVP39459.1 restriction endonuclease subunit S [Sinorhizobium meliloti]